MEKKELGIKTKGFIGGILAGVIICFVFFVLEVILVIYQFIKMNYINYGLLIGASIFLGLFVMQLVMYIKNLRQPKVMLEYDSRGIYINNIKETIFINYQNIKEVKAVKHYDRHHVYEFGRIMITTKDDIKHTVGVIYNVEDVKSQILKLKKEYKEYEF